jgi:hypothetical protein
MTDDKHLSELARQCANATAFSRLNHTEQLAVFSWLLDNGHMQRTGRPLQRPRPHPQAVAYAHDGAPIYAKGADFSPTETVVMPGAK